jgi:hypothetical protein
MSSFEQLMRAYWNFTSIEEFEKFFDENVADDFHIEYGPNMTIDKYIFLDSLRSIFDSFPGQICHNFFLVSSIISTIQIFIMNKTNCSCLRKEILLLMFSSNAHTQVTK